MDCIIRITRGPGEGQEFRCTTNETVVGRSPRSQVRLSSPSVSYEHAVITRDHDEFLIENLSANGTFVNDERITGKVRLRVKDQLRFGQETSARVEALPASAGAAGRRKLLVGATVASLSLTLVLIVVAVLSAPPQAGSYGDAYPKLEAYVQDQVAKKAISNQTLILLQDAWRLEMARDRATSLFKWRDLNILLASQEAEMGWREAGRRNPEALNKLRSRDKRLGQPTEEELKAGLVQFVSAFAKSSK